MDPEAEAGGAGSELKLPLFSKLASNVGYYNQESPLHVSASVPFRWEEEPGKPRPCSSSSSSSSSSSMIISSSRCLELPPRLFLLEAAGATTKLASPTTVLEGPYITSKPRSQSSSFRVVRRDWLYGSFRKTGAGASPDVEKKATRGLKESGLLGSFRVGRRVKRDVIGGHGDSYVFPSFMEGEVEDVKIGRRSESFSALSHTTRAHFWTTIYEGMKQVVPWRKSSRKSKRDGYVN